MWQDQPGHGGPGGFGRYIYIEFRLKYRVHALVERIIRAGTIKEMTIQLEDEHYGFCSSILMQCGLAILRPFSRLHNLDNVHVHLGIIYNAYAEIPSLTFLVPPKEYVPRREAPEERQERISRSKALEHRLQAQEQQMCSPDVPPSGPLLLDVWFVALYLELGNDIRVPAHGEFRNWMVYMSDWVGGHTESETVLRCFRGMVDILLEVGGDWIIHSGEEPADREVQYSSEYRSVVQTGPGSLRLYDHLEKIFEACALRNLPSLRQACRGLVVDWFRIRTIFARE